MLENPGVFYTLPYWNAVYWTWMLVKVLKQVIEIFGCWYCFELGA